MADELHINSSAPVDVYGFEIGDSLPYNGRVYPLKRKPFVSCGIKCVLLDGVTMPVPLTEWLFAAAIAAIEVKTYVNNPDQVRIKDTPFTKLHGFTAGQLANTLDRYKKVDGATDMNGLHIYVQSPLYNRPIQLFYHDYELIETTTDEQATQ